MTSSEKTVIGIDYGKTNIGVALGRNGLVAPLQVIPAKDIQTAINMINRLAIENKVQKFILGLPLTAENKETKQSLETRHFGKLLKVLSKRPVEYVNEFNTSQDAEDEAIETGITQKRRRINDHLAAALILKHYYDGIK